MKRWLLLLLVPACADVLGVHDYTYVEPGEGGGSDASGDAMIADGPIADQSSDSPVGDGGMKDAGCMPNCADAGTTTCALSCSEMNPKWLAIDSTRLYWANVTASTSFVSMPRPYGGPATFASTGAQPNGAIAYGAQYYFTDGANVRVAALDGGVRTLVSVPGAIGITGSPPQQAAPMAFYASGGSDAGIYHCVLPDCTSNLLQVDKRMDPQGLAAVWDPGQQQPYGFWSEVGVNPHPILGAAFVGGFAVQQYAQIANTTAMVAAEDLSKVWFVAYANGTSDLYKVGDNLPKFTTPGVVRAMVAGGGNVWLAIDDTITPANGRVVKFNGSTASFVAQNQDRPSSIAIDGTYVYWTTLGGTVMRAGR